MSQDSETTASRQALRTASAILFGSYGTPRQTPLSDVDIALVFRSGQVPGFDEEMALRADILGTRACTRKLGPRSENG